MVRQRYVQGLGPFRYLMALFSLVTWVFAAAVFHAWAMGAFTGAQGIVPAPAQSVANTAITLIILGATMLMELAVVIVLIFA